MNYRDECPACGMEVFEQCFYVDAYSILRCKHCKTMFVHNLPLSEDLSSIYESERYYELPPDSVKRIFEENKRRMNLIIEFVSKGVLLDIGCARGALLDEAARSGFETYGIEMSPKNSEIASMNGHNIYTGSLSGFAATNKGRTFEVVTCLDVIEHVEDPFDFIRTAESFLAPRGVLVLTTPNYSGLVARILGQRDPYMTPPEHLNFFTAKGLTALTNRLPLEIKRKCNFGKLTDAEMDRSLRRYIPKGIASAYPAVAAIVRAAFLLANRVGLGLEQEFYLKRRDVV